MKSFRSLIEIPVPILMVLSVIWLFADHLPWQNEVVVYKLFCVGGRHGDVCPTHEETANRTTYKALVDQQTVVYWSEDGEEPRRFGRCAVRDSKNWTCQFESAADATPLYVHRMIHGAYSETASPEAFGGPSTDVFYPVAKWRWWLVRLRSAG